MRPAACAWAALLLALVGCGAQRVTPDSDGVIASVGPCGRGLLVVESDYQSSNVSVLDFDGRVLSPSLVSSSTQASGFGVALSGDVVPPSSVQNGAVIALIDSYPAAMLRFVDLARGRITSELSVGTGFKSNPHDFLALSERKAYVPRYEPNPNSGQQPFDEGADILIVDPSKPEITGRIDLTPAMAGVPQGYSAHPAQVMRVSERVFVLLASYADDYKSCQVSRLVEIDPKSDELVSTLLLPDLRGCVHMALSPDATQLAVACVGSDLRAMPPKLAGSGLALVDIQGAPRAVKQFAAAALGTDPVGFSLDYAAPDRLLFETLGHFDRDTGAAAAQDTFLLLDAQTGGTRAVLQSLSEPFSLGGIRCAPGCGACFATDAERAGGSVLRFTIDGAGELGEPPQTVRAETRVGLPPRYLGAL
ncbi:MAG: hypothetical protein ABJB12_18810 [Pseudomonadota bacterium]